MLFKSIELTARTIRLMFGRAIIAVSYYFLGGYKAEMTELDLRREKAKAECAIARKEKELARCRLELVKRARGIN